MSKVDEAKGPSLPKEVPSRKCEKCGGRKKQRTRQYPILNVALNQFVSNIALCDSCALPFFIIQSEMKA